MCRMHGMTLGIALLLVAAGCGKPAGTDQPSTKPQGAEAAAANDRTDAVAQSDGPAGAVTQFLEAVRTANDEGATRMLTALARQKTAALKNRNVTPPASDNAKFTVGKVVLVGADGAQVACTWTDIDPDGQPKTDEAVWVVRREPDGWRVAGVAAQIPGEKPVLFNFEDPEDMFKKQQWIREEMRRRLEKEESGLQAQGGEKEEKPIRR